MFGNDPQGGALDALRMQRMNPMHGHVKQNAPEGQRQHPAPAGESDPVHTHLKNAHAAQNDAEKRGHVFKALNALTKRMKKAPLTPGQGAT